MKDFLILGPDPSHSRGRSFDDEALHGLVLSRDRVGSEEIVRGLDLFPSRRELVWVPVGAVIEFWPSTTDQAYFEHSILKLEFRKNRDSACIVSDPHSHPSFVTGGGAIRLA